MFFLLSVGCQMSTDVPLVTRTNKETTFSIDTTDFSVSTATPIVEFALTPFLTYTPTVTAPSTEIPVLTPLPQRICSLPAQKFNVMSSLGIYEIARLAFRDETTIVFDGWGSRPELEVGANATTNPPALGLEGIPSARTMLKWGQIDLRTGIVSSQTLSFAALYQNPCLGNCPIEVIGQSPNEEWQLVQVSDWTESRVWLVGKDEMVQLVGYVPAFSTWSWSNDSTLLWFTHSVYDFGYQTLLVQLSPSSVVVLSEGQGKNKVLFDATHYLLAFSPLEKTVFATPSEEAFPQTDELFFFDLNQYPFQIGNPEIVIGIETVIWNEATQSYLLLVIQENGLEIRNILGTVLVKVPITTFEEIFPIMTNTTYDIKLGQLLPKNNFALSSSNQYLAWGYGNPGLIFVLECQQ